MLESWVWSQQLISLRAYRIGGVTELSEPLRRLAHRCNGGESVWGAWTDGIRTWFVAAVPSLELARERKKPVLQIKVYDEHGEMVTATTCVRTTHHGWQQCT